MDGVPAFQADVLHIDFHKEAFDRSKGRLCDPPEQVIRCGALFGDYVSFLKASIWIACLNSGQCRSEGIQLRNLATISKADAISSVPTLVGPRARGARPSAADRERLGRLRQCQEAGQPLGTYDRNTVDGQHGPPARI